MTLPLLVRRSLGQHVFSSAVCVAAIALAGGLLMSVWGLKEGARQAFARAGGGYDAVLGARGSKLQLVLNGLFHMDESPGTLPVSDWLALRSHPAVAAAIPLAMGDNYRGDRVVGTVTNFFTEVPYAEDRYHQVRPPGRWFLPNLREAVVGSVAAQRLGLQRGAHFRPYHGLNYDPDHEHEEDYLVVGVLEPSNTPADRVLWIPLAGVQQMSGHDPARATELSAVLVRLKPGSVVAGQQLDRQYNRDGTRLTLAWPVAHIVARLFERVAWIERVLVLVAWLVAVVAAATVLITLYGSLSERRRDLAILRALGAHRRTVFGVLFCEALVLSVVGVALAFAVHAAIHALAANVIRDQTGMVLGLWNSAGGTAVIAAALVALGSLAGVVPALKAYREDVATNLTPLA
jgi:putative ABC transport system permease protein